MYYNIKAYSDNGNMVNFSLALGIVITDIVGLTETNVEMATSQGVAQVGVTVQNEAVSGKAVVISGMVVGDSTMYRKRLVDTFVPQVGVTLIFNNELELRVRPQVTPAIERAKMNAEFQFTCFAAYPYWRSIERANVVIGGMIPKFRFPINYYEPITHKFGERVQTFFVDANNKGNVKAPFDVVFLAKTTVLNPKITKVDTLEFILIDREMVPNERVTVSMIGGAPRVFSLIGGVETEITGQFHIDSTPFELDVGENYLRYDADVGRDNLECTLILQPAFSGAYGTDDVSI